MQQPPKDAATNETAPCFVVKAEVRRIVKDLDHHVSGDFPDALSRRVEEMIKKAAVRAKHNGRKLLRPHDL